MGDDNNATARALGIRQPQGLMSLSKSGVVFTRLERRMTGCRTCDLVAFADGRKPVNTHLNPLCDVAKLPPPPTKPLRPER